MRIAISATLAVFCSLVAYGLLAPVEAAAEPQQPAAIVMPASILAVDVGVPTKPATTVLAQDAAPMVEQVFQAPAESAGDLVALSPQETRLLAEYQSIKQRHEARETQWRNWFNSINRYVQSKGLPPLKRMGDRQTGSATNTGVYGEGRPATGQYGKSKASFGSIPVDCPKCQRKL